jgi:hypothetical protein
LTLGSLVQLGRGAHAMTTPQGNRPRIENILSDGMRERQSSLSAPRRGKERARTRGAAR